MANFSLLAKLGLDSKSFQRGLDTAKKKAQGFSKNIGKIFAATAALGGLTALIKKSIEFGTVLSDAAGQLNMSAKAFQILTGAMKDAGGTQKQLEKNLLNMQRAIVQGSEGLTTFIRAFERIGLNIDDLRNMSPEQQFIAISSAIANADDKAGALTATVEIFGGKSRQLTEVMKRLTEDGFVEMGKEIEKTHGLMRDSTAQALDEIADNMQSLSNKTTVAIGELTVAFLSFSDIIGRSLKSIVTFFGGLFFSFSAIVQNFVQRFKSVNRVIGHLMVDLSKQIFKTLGSISRAFEQVLSGDFKGAVDTLAKSFEGTFRNTMQAIDEETKKLNNSQQRTIDALTDLYFQAGDEIKEEIAGIIKAYRDLIGETELTNKKLEDDLIPETGGGGDGDGDGDGTGGTGGKGKKEDKFAQARSVAREAFKASAGDLAKLGTAILQEKGMKDSRIEQFQTVGGEERFRRFDGGRIAGEFTREQIAAGIGKSAQEEVGGEGAIENILESIKETLEGKFVNE